MPSVEELPSSLMIWVSADGRLLRRFNDLDFGEGGWTPFSSNVLSTGSFFFTSKYLIMLLLVSAIKSFPASFHAIIPVNA